MRAVHVNIYGAVQGVGYRRWLRDICTKLSIKGWVRNSSDGSVECFFQGDAEAVNNILISCWEGSKNSEVDDILEKEGTEETLIDFKIL